MADRPSWTETAGVLLACAALLVALVHIDAAALRRHQVPPAADAGTQRATTQPLPVADTPVVMPSRAPATVAAEDVPGRAMALGWLGLVALAGLGMCAAGLRALRRRSE